MGPMDTMNNTDWTNGYYENGGAVELPPDGDTADVEIADDDGPVVDMTDDLSAWM